MHTSVRLSSCQALRTLATAALFVGTALATSPAAAQTRVGVNTAVNPDATGLQPGGTLRRLTLGQDVVYNERIATSTVGQTQIAFLDESTMSVGPNSDLVIDRFVYDPQAGVGTLAASATRGVFRYVGGRISKLENAVNLRTPDGMIGIRGGVFLMNLKPDGSLEAIFVYGVGLSVTGLNGVRQVATRPGYEITVAGPGASPSAPAPAPPGVIASLLAQLDGHPGMNAGAQTIPTNTMVEQNGTVFAGGPGTGSGWQPPGYGGLPPVEIGGFGTPRTPRQPPIYGRGNGG